jgi:molybdate transport system permease protein
MAAAFALCLLLGAPIAAVVALGNFQAMGRQVVVDALVLSLGTSAMTVGLAFVLGTPTAYALARWTFPGKSWIDVLIELPIVLPPAVAGIGLLLVFGRRGILGAPLEAIGVSIGFTTAAVVLAQTFVAAPLYVRALRAGLTSVDREPEEAARADGATEWAVFWSVTVPLAMPALVAGLLLCWARALGEFGATIMFAGSLQASTQTLPLAIYAALESDLDAAIAMAAVLVGASLLILVATRALIARVDTIPSH